MYDKQKVPEGMRGDASGPSRPAGDHRWEATLMLYCGWGLGGGKRGCISQVVRPLAPSQKGLRSLTGTRM